MLEHYKTIYEGGEGELVEKKSRFIATVRPVETEEEALAFIEEMKKKYWDARHNCYVYSVGMNREATRCSDDGEPSGTAGRPMLDVLLGAGIYNAAIVVTRYFGGVLLGTGGLVRAYSGAVQAGLAASTVIEKHHGIFSSGDDGLYRDRKDPVYRRRKKPANPGFRVYRQGCSEASCAG